MASEKIVRFCGIHRSALNEIICCQRYALRQVLGD
jgi:hypothetical protein